MMVMVVMMSIPEGLGLFGHLEEGSLFMIVLVGHCIYKN